MATSDSINDHMTRLRLKMVEQKLAKERARQRSEPEDNSETGKVKLQQALLKRQSLMDRIRMTEQSLNDYNRHRSHSADNRKELYSTPSPRPSSRRSLPEQTSKKHLKPVVLEPLERSPSIKFVEAPDPQIRVLQPPTYITQPPAPLPPAPPQPSVYIQEPTQKWSKSDYMEMMMMENAQLHQHMMRQMMYQSLQPQQNNSPKFTIPLMALQQAHQQPQYIQMPDRRPPSVHHHHYTTTQHVEPTRPYINHVTHLPPLEKRLPPAAPSVKILPAEVEPLRQPRVREPPQARPLSKPSPLPPPPAPVKKHPFPGSRLLRKLRHIFYAAWFIAFLRAEVKKNKKPTKKFLFGIKLKEAVAALHRIYLNPDGKIFPILSDAVGDGAIDLSVDVTNERPSTDDKQAFQELVYIVENITYNITDIMPETGVLGTHKKAAVFELIKDGHQFPLGYFWQIEKDLLEFDENEATKNIDNKRASMLLLGIFVSRSLVTTLMMKPLDYGLSTTVLGTVAENNLRLLATIFIYIVRKTVVPPNDPPLPMPYEISSYLYSDEDMKGTYTKLKKSIDYAEGLFRDWGDEYVKRLRNAVPQATT